MPADLPPVVDCHVHPFLGAGTNTSWFPGTDTPETFAAELRRAGIARWCGAPIRPLPAPTFADVDGLNRDRLALAGIFGEAYIPAATVHPAFPEESCATLEKLYGDGVRWIGELVAYMSGYNSSTCEVRLVLGSGCGWRLFESEGEGSVASPAFELAVAPQGAEGGEGVGAVL